MDDQPTKEMTVNRTHRRNPAPVVALAVLAAAASAWLAPSVGQTASATPAETPAVNPEATAALDRMGAYLRTIQALQVEVATEREEVLDNGLKVQLEETVNLLARKPDRLRLAVSSDRKERLFLYDGKELTLWAPRVKYYASVPAPPTIGELASTLEEKYGIELPLVDLFRWGSKDASAAAITSAVDLGPGTVGGTTCQHYAFRQEGLDWQIWIQKGDFPLPRKLVLTTTTDEARPQYQATYSWNLAPSFNDAAFTFVPTADAHKILLAEAAPEAGAGK